jgi:hypothetical protein
MVLDSTYSVQQMQYYSAQYNSNELKPVTAIINAMQSEWNTAFPAPKPVCCCSGPCLVIPVACPFFSAVLVH